MNDIKSHLDTIREIDGTGYRRRREREQALEEVAGSVAAALLEGRQVPVYCSVEGFFHIKGFEQAVAAQLAVRHETLIEQRAKLADRLEEKGVAYGPEAARILRQMNAAASHVMWMNVPELTDEQRQALLREHSQFPSGSVVAVPRAPGWSVEPAPAGGPFDSVARNDRPADDDVDHMTEGLASLADARRHIEAADARQRSERMRVELAETLGLSPDAVQILPASEPIRPTDEMATYNLTGEVNENGIVEWGGCGGDDEGDDLTDLATSIAKNAQHSIECMERDNKIASTTSMFPFNGYWISVKVERAEEFEFEDDDTEDEDEGPAYETVSQDNIRPGDYAEYHDGDSVRRWLVLTRNLTAQGAPCVRVQLIDDHIHATEVVELPLPGDPFILRPRS